MKTIISDIKQWNIGQPKIIIPLCGDDFDELQRNAAAYAESDADIIEWRIDGLSFPMTQSAEYLPQIRSALKNKVLLVTCRTKNEGGNADLTAEQYAALCTALCQSGLPDMIDIELTQGTDAVKELIAIAHRYEIAAIVSSHDFGKTPPRQEMIDRLRTMQLLGADIAKLAVMPHSKTDVAELLGATAYMADHHPDCPVITMSMGKTGVVSRIGCEAFGSCATFTAAGQSSAPGQPPLTEAISVLSALHRWMG